MGGGFGSKQVAWKHDVIAALLAQQAGRPVQLMLDREAENLAAGNRNATRQRVRIGARRDGTLTAIAAHIDLETGAYQVGGEASDVSRHLPNALPLPNVRTDQQGVYTNTGPAVAFRAPGHVEAAFALEQAMDELARELGLDPLELRLRNYTERDQSADKPNSSPEALRRCYERATEAFGWGEQRADQPADGAKRRGVGLRRARLGGRQRAAARLRLGQAQRRRHGRGRHRHAGYRHRHAHRPGPDRRRRARAADGARSACIWATPRTARTRRPAPAARPRRRSVLPCARRPPRPSASCCRQPRRCWKSRAERLAVRDGTVVVVERSAQQHPGGRGMRAIAPHMIAGPRRARAEPGGHVRCAPSAPSASRSRSTSRPAR